MHRSRNHKLFIKYLVKKILDFICTFLYMHIIIRKHELYYKQVNFIVEELELMSIREKHTDKMEEILEKEMYADEGFSEIDEEDQRPETQKVMKQERRQQRKKQKKKLEIA